MRDHGHSWWRVFLWQAGSCVLWTALLPVVLALARRFPVALDPRPLLVHGGAALALGALHLMGVTWLALLLDPYRPVAESTSFVAEYGGTVVRLSRGRRRVLERLLGRRRTAGD